MIGVIGGWTRIVVEFALFQLFSSLFIQRFSHEALIKSFFNNVIESPGIIHLLSLVFIQLI